MTRRIAAWSGPRNISTAMMRAFENRPDTTVSDEPFYAAYLHATGLHHPGREAVLASQSTDPSTVATHLTGPVPGGMPIWYQKHMTHHLLPTLDRRWMADLQHIFLIRDPRRVIASYAQRRHNPTLEDLGFPQQRDIFRHVQKQLGHAPPVIDADDVLRDPAGILAALCDALHIPFSDRMLQWPAGPRDTDGVWAPHWYDRVLASTGFGAHRPALPTLSGDQRTLAAAAQPIYAELATHRLQTTATRRSG